jgi:hypothetical protein
MLKKISGKNLVRVNANGSHIVGATFDISWHFEKITEDYWVEGTEIDNAIATFLLHKDNVIDSTSGKVYFTKTSTIPRYKLKEYLDVNQIGIDRTNRVDRAQTYIISFNTIKYLKKELLGWGSSGKEVIIPTQEFLSISNANYSKKLTNYIRNYQTDYVAIDGNYFEEVKKECPGATLQEMYFIDQGWGFDKKTNIVDTIIYLLNKINNVKIVFDETLLEQCTKEITIDPSTYENIRSMLLSKDDGNVQLAIEMISNCNYVESKHYILFLLNEFWNVCIKRADKTTNFNNCLKYFSPYRNMIPNNWQLIVDALLKETPSDEHKELIKNYIVNRINATNVYRGASFKIEDVKLAY